MIYFIKEDKRIGRYYVHKLRQCAKKFDHLTNGRKVGPLCCAVTLVELLDDV